jgi:hypothetical protein
MYVERALSGTTSVANVGAGTGSYEPPNTVVAVEPSGMMIAQRPAASAPAVRAMAERLPLATDSVDATLAVLTAHHCCATTFARRPRPTGGSPSRSPGSEICPAPSPFSRCSSRTTAPTGSPAPTGDAPRLTSTLRYAPACRCSLKPPIRQSTASCRFYTRMCKAANGIAEMPHCSTRPRSILDTASSSPNCEPAFPPTAPMPNLD